MNEMTVFEHPTFGQVRAMSIDGDPWFVGKDVAERLGYSNTRKALADHVDDEDKMDGVTIRDSIGRAQNPVFINESGLYALILSSKLPLAKLFKRWVTSEVLPSIRRTGGYTNSAEANKRAELIRCAEILATCTDASRPYVLRILNCVMPGLTMEPLDPIGSKNTAVSAPPPAPDPAPVLKVPRNGYAKPFDHEMLDRLITEKGYTNKQVEKLIGCSGKHSTVARWRRGACNPGAEYRRRLCTMFQLTPGSFDK